MTTEAPNWYKEKIRDQIRARNKVAGGLLDGTMTAGDGHAGTVKFPVISGEVLVYKVTGAIQRVTNSNPHLSMLSVQMEDWEAATWMRIQDFRKQGPNEQAAVGREMQKAIRIKRDDIKIDALAAIADATSTLPTDPKTVQTIGDGSTNIDLIDLIQARTLIAGTGDTEAIYCAIPEAWMDQLEMYKEFVNADYIGSTDLPFARQTNVRKRTFRNVHVMTLPDRYFRYGTGKYGTGSSGMPFDDTKYLDAFMWTKEAMGAETEWSEENMSLTTHPEMEGTPTLGKVGLSAAAVGLLPEGIKRLRFKAQNRAVRPA